MACDKVFLEKGVYYASWFRQEDKKLQPMLPLSVSITLLRLLQPPWLIAGSPIQN